MKNLLLIDKAKACLLGVCIGDALGMPVETLTAEQILEETKGKGITDFINPINRKEWVIGLKAGDTTDDWQLTRAVGTSLVRTSGKFDVSDCAREHVLALKQSTFGWGKTTQTAIEAIMNGERDPLKDPLPPAPPGKGCGNGVIMKIAPLAIANCALSQSREVLWKACHHLGSITHPDIRASISAFAVAELMNDVFTHGISDARNCIGHLQRIISHVDVIERRHDVKDTLISQRLKKVLVTFSDATELRKTVGCGFHAVETAAFAIGTFLRHLTDFRTGVLEAVNAGGDTDTNASVVGALIGANTGLDAIPLEWRRAHPSFSEALELGEKLCFE